MRHEKRKMKPYHPRGTHSERSLEKQQLADLEHRMSVNIGSFLVLLEEGTPQQVEVAKQKAKAEWMKYGPDMQKLAEKMGGKFPTSVKMFLDSVDTVLHTAAGWIDQATIDRCYEATQRLEKELHRE